MGGFMQAQKKIFSVKEAAEYTGLSQFYVYKLIHQKKIPHYKPNNGRVFFKIEDLENYIFRNRQAADFEVSHA